MAPTHNPALNLLLLDAMPAPQDMRLSLGLEDPTQVPLRATTNLPNSRELLHSKDGTRPSLMKQHEPKLSVE